MRFLAVDTLFHSRRSVAVNSTDLNLIDYKTWGDIQQRVYQMHSVDEPKKRSNVWHNMDQSVIDDAIDGWRKHL